MKEQLRLLLSVFKGLASAIVISALLLTLSGCAVEQSPHGKPEVIETPHSLEQTLEQYEDEFMAIDGVVGVGIGRCDEQDCLIVLLEQDTPELRSQIPDQVDGVPIGIEISGSIEIETQ